ncbi:hypothetical protein SEA_AMGINE_52 [Mycobacterium phage Amgine]|uniref:Uncharacterized protein n=1 Tax=Mycobacterium phage Amgine TaxID=2015817 RepID=A0A222ZLM5_9CAUD|nr:hypothetical protein I5G84_gp52 [Mycobacterium phage Amgine]ASR85653.1 hypothetical protein SEA_AMGINE_52 [Mycobacterium phage Amgine]
MSDQPMCQACKTFPAHVFDPDGTMRCGGCAHLDLRAEAASSPGTEAGDPEAWVQHLDDLNAQLLAGDDGVRAQAQVWVGEALFGVDYAAMNARWREQGGEPNVADTLDEADKAYVWADVCGAHWGWTEGNGWVAWNTGVAPYERGAVGPFAVVFRRPDVEASNAAGEALTSDDAEVSNDMVAHPSHYTSSPARCKACGEPIECIDITQHMGFCLGNATKYVWRCDLKHDAIEDLRKAIQYIEFEIARREQQSAVDATTKG